MSKAKINYQHVVAKIESVLDRSGKLYVRFLFFLDDGSTLCFTGPRGQWLWVSTKGRSKQEVIARIESFSSKALYRLFRLSDFSMHIKHPSAGRN